MRGWRDYVEQAPDEVTVDDRDDDVPGRPGHAAAIHDREVAIVGGIYVGDPEEGLRVMAPLRELGTPLFDMSQPTPFTAVQAGLRPAVPAQPAARVLEVAVPRGAVRRGDRRHRRPGADRPAPLTLVNTFHMGGAIAAVDPEATAFAERSAPYMVSIDGMWDDPADDADEDRLGALGVGGGRARSATAASTSTSPASPTRHRAPASTPRSAATSSGWRRSRRPTTRTTSSASTTTSSPPERSSRPAPSAPGARLPS